MTQYILKIHSYGGLVPGASHYRGTVEGPYPKSCHGGTVYRGSGPLAGKTTCAEGHELPGRIEWQVEAKWTPDQYDRYAAARFEGDGPADFGSAADVRAAAVAWFTGTWTREHWFEPHVTPGAGGDELWYGWVSRPQDADLTDEDDRWGLMLARVPTLADRALADVAGHPATSASAVAARIGAGPREVLVALIGAERDGRARRTRPGGRGPWLWELPAQPQAATAGRP